MHWGKLDAEKLVKDGPPEGKAHRHPEMYYDGVIKGARLVADECTKDTIFELIYSCHVFNLKTKLLALCSAFVI